MSKSNEETQEPKVKLRSLSGSRAHRPQRSVEDAVAHEVDIPPGELGAMAEIPVAERITERRRAVKGKAKKGVPVRHLCFDEQRDKMLFQLQLATSQALGRRVTVSELARIGVDCLGEMETDELLRRLNED